MKRAFAVAIILVLLVSALAGASLVNSATANFIGLAAPHIKSVKILVEKPLNNSICRANYVYVRFSFVLSGWVPSPDDQRRYIGGVYPPNIKSSMMCFLDGRLVWQSGELDSLGIFNFAFSLSDLSLGSHSLTFKSETRGDFFYGTYNSYVGGWAWDRVNSRHSSCAVFFTAATPPPMIQILSVKQQQVFDVGDVPLSFSVSKPVDWVGYSLDGHDNVTVSGNLTLGSLSQGGHNLVVYATDTYGQTGKSLVHYFTIAQSSSFFSSPFPLVCIEVTIIASAAIISFGLLAYLLRRKRKD